MNYEKIASYLQTKRKEKGITQAELAKELGVTYQAVSRWETGKSIPDIDTLSNLADFYELSVDEILQKTATKRRQYILNDEDTVDGISNIVIKVSYRYFILPLLLLLVLPAFSIFFDYTNHVVSHVMAILVLLIASLITMYKIKIERKMRFYLIFTGILFVLSMGIYIANFRYYNIMETVYFEKVEEVESDFRWDDYEMLTSYSDLYKHILFFTEYDSAFYYFDLDEELSEMDHKIELNDLLLNTVIFYDEEIYFSVRKDIDDSTVITEIYKLDYTDDSYVLIKTLDGDFRIFNGIDGILIASTPFYSSEPQLHLYKPGFDSMQELSSPTDHIYDMKYVGGGTWVATICNDGCRVVRFSENFHDEETLIGSNDNSQRLIRGSEYVIVHSDGQLFAVTENSITELSEEFTEDKIQFTYSGMYLYGGNLYDRDLNYLSGIVYTDDEFYTHSATYMFSEGEYSIVFENYTTVKLQPIGIEVSRLFIDSYFRHVYLLIAVLSVGKILLMGDNKKRVESR